MLGSVSAESRPRSLLSTGTIRYPSKDNPTLSKLSLIIFLQAVWGFSSLGKKVIPTPYSPNSGRIIPDCIREWSSNKIVKIRNPRSTRPWQHVLDVLSGYILLAKKLNSNDIPNGEVFNFGPKVEKKREVINLVKEMNKIWKKGRWIIKKNNKFQESNLLQLNSNKAKKILKWECKMNLKKTINFTAEWYKYYFLNKKKIFEFSLAQIKKFESLSKK